MINKVFKIKKINNNKKVKSNLIKKCIKLCNLILNLIIIIIEYWKQRSSNNCFEQTVFKLDIS